MLPNHPNKTTTNPQTNKALTNQTNIPAPKLHKCGSHPKSRNVFLADFRGGLAMATAAAGPGGGCRETSTWRAFFGRVALAQTPSFSQLDLIGTAWLRRGGEATARQRQRHGTARHGKGTAALGGPALTRGLPYYCGGHPGLWEVAWEGRPKPGRLELPQSGGERRQRGQRGQRCPRSASPRPGGQSHK